MSMLVLVGILEALTTLVMRIGLSALVVVAIIMAVYDFYRELRA